MQVLAECLWLLMGGDEQTSLPNNSGGWCTAVPPRHFTGLAVMVVCGHGCYRWSKRKLLDKVGWLPLSTSGPQNIEESHYLEITPRNTRNAAHGQIRQGNSFSSFSTFKNIAMQGYTSVPVCARTESTVTVKKSQSNGSRKTFPLTRVEEYPEEYV